MRTYYPVLSIAGSDPSGGAGIQADIKTMSAIGCYAMSVITALTAQNTSGVTGIMPATPEIVTAQIDAVMTDIPPLAVKLGMLCNAEVTEAVADRLNYFRPDNIVVDPVIVSTSGSVLLSDDGLRTLSQRILPLSAIVTPNRREAELLTGETDMNRQIDCLREMGCRNILITGGDSERTDFKIDILSVEGSNELIELRADAIETRNTHGTGCTLSSAIASYLALGNDLTDAVRMAKLYVTHALSEGSWVTTGKGHGPVNHFFSPRRLKNFNPNRRQS
ncbi:MAG: bifunctional hydroxymethylpyrimidine kinase/phosphomethylpyrimidine kinase [Bacteroides sp.]|nr:bifunctional hydroxymethylpyrimidine kinase/phosphomethylpyrimidine kinase [Bacteroides sp.]